MQKKEEVDLLRKKKKSKKIFIMVESELFILGKSYSVTRRRDEV